MAANHSIPSPQGPQIQQRPGQTRERAKSGFSIRSNHSKKSSGSVHKINLHETHQEKDSKRLHTKADPSMAMTEAEPSAVASNVQSSLQSIRGIQHRDAQGNPIADPDRNNPTRSRWERPLDTIRSFEAAIDGNYSRKSYIRSDTSDATSNYNRPTSYYGDDRPRYPPNSMYGGRTPSYRPESTYAESRYNGAGRPDSYYTTTADHAGGPNTGYQQNRARYPRTASEPHFNNVGQGVYPGPGNSHSYETVTTASGGSSAEAAEYGTGPSSVNSSVDRFAPPPVAKEPQETYGFNGFGNTPQFVPPGSSLNGQHVNSIPRQFNGYQTQAPALPTKDHTSGGPIRLGETGGNATPPVVANMKADKRKSWFSKRFSKSS